MIFRKEVYFTRNMEDYNRAKAALMDDGIEYTSKSNSMTNPGRFHGTPICLLKEKMKKRQSRRFAVQR